MSFGASSGFVAGAARIVLGVESGQFNAELAASEANFARFAGSLSGAQGEIAERSLRAGVALQRYEQVLRQVPATSLQARAALATYIGEMRRLNDVAITTTGSLGRFERGMVAAGVRGVGFGHALAFASNAFLGGAGFVYAVHAATKAASDFQAEMQLIQTQALKSHAEVVRMTEAVKHLAGPLATAPIELSKGLYRIESAGYTGGKALQFLSTAVKGARIGHSDLERTIQALVAAQKAGIHGANDLAGTMSKLDAIVGASDTRMEDLTKAISSGVIPAAQQAGVSLAEFGGAMSTLTIHGTPAELAATRLRYSIALLAVQTPKAEKELRSIGLQAGELGRKMRSEGLVAAVDLLATKLHQAGIDGQDTHAILERAFGGGRSYTTILDLVMHLDQLRERTQLIAREGTNKLFDERWRAHMQTAEYQFDKLKAAAESLKIQIGDALLPVTVRSAEGISEWLSKSANQARVTRDVAEGFRDAQKAAHVFADAMHQVADVLHMTDRLIGGTGHSVKLLLEALLLRKALGFAKTMNAEFLEPLRGVKNEANAAAQALAHVDEAAAAAGAAGIAPISGGTLAPEAIPVWRQADWMREQERKHAAEEEKKRADAAAVGHDEAADAAAVEQQATQRLTAAQQANQKQTQADVVAANEKTDALERQARATVDLADAQVSQAQAAEAASVAPLAAAAPTERQLRRLSQAHEKGGLSLAGLRGGDELVQQAALRHIVTSGNASVGAVAQGAGISPMQASEALAALASRGVVSRRGGEYAVAPEWARGALSQLHPRYAEFQRYVVGGGELYPKQIARIFGVSEAEAMTLLQQGQARGLLTPNPKAGQIRTSYQRYTARDVLETSRLPGLTDAEAERIARRANAAHARRYQIKQPPFVKTPTAPLLVPDLTGPPEYAQLGLEREALAAYLETPNLSAAEKAAAQERLQQVTLGMRDIERRPTRIGGGGARTRTIPGQQGSTPSLARPQYPTPAQYLATGPITDRRYYRLVAGKKVRVSAEEYQAFSAAQPPYQEAPVARATAAGERPFYHGSEARALEAGQQQLQMLRGDDAALRARRATMRETAAAAREAEREAAAQDAAAKQRADQAAKLARQRARDLQEAEKAATAATRTRIEEQEKWEARRRELATQGVKLYRPRSAAAREADPLYQAQQAEKAAAKEITAKKAVAAQAAASAQAAEQEAQAAHNLALERERDARLATEFVNAEDRRVAAERAAIDTAVKDTRAVSDLTLAERKLAEAQEQVLRLQDQARLKVNRLTGMQGYDPAYVRQLREQGRFVRGGVVYGPPTEGEAAAAETMRAANPRAVRTLAQELGVSEAQMAHFLAREERLAAAQRMEAEAVDGLVGHYDALTGRYVTASEAVTKLTEAEARAARVRQINGDVYLGDRRVRPAFFGPGGDAAFLAQKEQQLSRLGAIRAGVGSRARQVGGFLGSQQFNQNALGYGMALTFAPQLIPGLNSGRAQGVTNLLQGVGGGLLFAPMLGVQARYGAAVGGAFGLKSAIGGQSGSLRDKVGSGLGMVGEGAALGATLGTFGGPFAALSVPAGAGIGAAVGLTAAFLKLTKTVDHTADNMMKLANAADIARGRVKLARANAEAATNQLAVDRYTKLQARQALEDAQAQEKAARGTQGHAAAVVQLMAAQSNWRAANKQVLVDLRTLRESHQQVRSEQEKAKKKTDELADKLVDEGRKAQKASALVISGARGGAAAQQTASAKAERYAASMDKIAEKAKKTNPRLARTATELANIARETDKIPTDPKYVRVILRFGYDPKSLQEAEQAAQSLFSAFNLGGVKPLDQLAAGQNDTALASTAGKIRFDAKRGLWVGPNGRPVTHQDVAWNAFLKSAGGPKRPTAGQTIPLPKGVNAPKQPPVVTEPNPRYIKPGESQELTHLERLIAEAQARGQGGKVPGLIDQELAWLWRDLKLATNDVQATEVLNAINQLKSQKTSLASKDLRNGGLGIIPQGLQDAYNTAAQSNNKTGQIAALRRQESFLRDYLEKHPTGLAHKKANDLLTQVVRHIERLTKVVEQSPAKLIPANLQQRVEIALQNAVSKGGTAKQLRAERKEIVGYLGEKGHTPEQTREARAKLKQVNKELGIAAKGGGGYGPVIDAIQAEISWLRRFEHKPSTSIGGRLAAEKEITKLEKQIASFQSKGGQLSNNPTWLRLENAVYKAKQTLDTTDDDIKAYKAEKAFLTRIRNQAELHHDQKLQLTANKLLAGIDAKLSKLVSTADETLLKMEQQFLEEQRSFWSQFGSNTFHGRQVGSAGNRIENVHVYFPHPPSQDGTREGMLIAAHARAAYE